MNFTPRTITQIVVIVSLISALIDVVIAMVNGTPWWVWLLSGLATYLITFFLLRYFLERYIVFRVKPLYQILLSKDIVTSRLSKELRKQANDDVIETTQQTLDQLVAFSSDEIERLVVREQERSEFMEGIAHEINNPVRNIQSYVMAALGEDMEDPKVVREYLERILRSANRLVEQVDDIHKLSQYQSGGAIMYKEDFDLPELIYEIFDTNILRARERNIRFKIDWGTFPTHEKIIAYADRYRIGSVLNNLLLNAIQYNKPGGSVTVGFVDMFDKVLVEVSDTGIGIAPQDLPRIFERSFRADRTDGPPGSGLGLAAVKLAIDCHGENITARSKLGVGTTLSFTLSKPS